jgi:hypothetical protein
MKEKDSKLERPLTYRYYMTRQPLVLLETRKTSNISIYRYDFEMNLQISATPSSKLSRKYRDGLSVNISIKDDVTVILLLGVSFSSFWLPRHTVLEQSMGASN